MTVCLRFALQALCRTHGSSNSLRCKPTTAEQDATRRHKQTYIGLSEKRSLWIRSSTLLSDVCMSLVIFSSLTNYLSVISVTSRVGPSAEEAGHHLTIVKMMMMLCP
ncbi:hypothetical protein LX36DRAFT_280458 [Colletotrichum falcatum]|nr:hypothetical protein LX36DRAFT_280458 [Colletotrichum falcatum]